MKNALPPAVLVLALTILSTAPQQGLGPAINSATYRPRFAIYGSACAELGLSYSHFLETDPR